MLASATKRRYDGRQFRNLGDGAAARPVFLRYHVEDQSMVPSSLRGIPHERADRRSDH